MLVFYIYGESFLYSLFLHISKHIRNFNFIKVLELEKESDFDSRHVKPRQKISMVTLKGEIPSSTSRASPAEKVLKDYIDIDVNSLPLRDPACLVISQLHECLLAWQLILHVGDDLDQSDILKWLKIMLGGSTSH